MKQKITLLIMILFASFVGQAQTLSAGDIAIIGTNYDVSPYEMTIVNLAPIAANTVIRITDYGYDETTGTFGTTSVSNTSEGSITWTTTALAAGTVTKLTISGGATPVVTGLPGTVTVTGWSNATATNCPVPAGGDNWFVFQGNSPTSINNFIFAWTNTFSATFNAINQPAGQFNVSGSGAPNNNNSYLPPSLTLGSTAIALNRDPSNGGYHGDNNVYTGIKSGAKSAILAEICNVSKWTRSETITYDISPGGTSFPGTNPIFNVDLGVLLSTSPTLTFTQNSSDITGDNIASDGEGGSQSISDIDIQIYNISNTSGTLSSPLTWQNNSFLSSSSGSYTALTNPNNAGSKGMAIKSANGSEFKLNQFVYYNWGETQSLTNTVKGFRDGSEVASTTFEGYNLPYNPTTITLPSSFENIDEVRFYITAGGYIGDQSASNHSINSIKVSSPVANSAPTDITLSTSTVNENVVANTTVGTLSSTDADAANTFTYTLVAGAGSTDNTAFNISGNSLRITASPDFETKASYSVRVRTADQGGLTFEKVFTISITNVNETPTDIVLSTSTVSENVAANTTVGTLSSTDADAANTFTYTLVAGAGSTDNTAFNISGNSLRITASPDFETKASYSVRVRTADQGGLTFEKVFTISITNVNEAPTDIVLSTSTVIENVAANTTVGTLSSTDADTANTFTYTLVAGAGDTDNASFNISGSNLRITASPNFETKASYSVRVRTSDQGGLTFEKVFVITIDDLCDLDNSVTLNLGVLTATQSGATYQWYNCSDNSTVGTNSNAFTPTQLGNYKVDITVGSCTVTSTCITVTSLGTTSFETTPKLSVYPNPSQGTVNIESDSNGDYQVMNQLGQIVKTFQIKADIVNTIDLHNLNDSVYFIKEINNSKNKSHKLIIKK